jgi:membrane-bound lytic murein transglycosylase D
MRRACAWTGVALCALAWVSPLRAADPAATALGGGLPLVGATSLDAASLPAPRDRNGLEIFHRFRDGLADPQCDAAATSARWKQHFGHAPLQLARPDDDLLPLFGYVVDALREAHLPTEFALIPFVESGYRPGARSASGPAGLWQFVGVTARNHGIRMGEAYDGRLSPVDSTQAAVRYLKTLHGMFGGDWRLAVMAYNAGEYRILQSMRSAGMNAGNAQPQALPGLSGITYSYVEKLHALACVLQQAQESDEWLQDLDRPVPQLLATAVPAGAGSLDAWAAREGHDGAMIRRLNPALPQGLTAGGKPVRVLAPVGSSTTLLASALPVSMPVARVARASTAAAAPIVSANAHTVRRGESAWVIARRYGLRPEHLLKLNKLPAKAVLRPGMVLRLVEGDQ